MSRNILPNPTAYIKNKLNKEAMDKLKSYVKNKKNNYNHRLAGNLSNSFSLEDKDNWFFNNVLLKLISEYNEKDIETIVYPVLTKDCEFVLHNFWVNFQNKYEFNPLHHHDGVFSFVVWMEIPSSYEKEKQLKFAKESNSPNPNTFEFIYTNVFGRVCMEKFHLEPKDKGTILLFPSYLSHQVYPFYLSNKKRISISGNIKLDPTKHV